MTTDGKTMAMPSADAPARPGRERRRSQAAAAHARAERILMVGTGERATRVAGRLRDASKYVVGAVDDDPQTALGQAFPDVPWLGRLNDLQRIVLEHGVEKLYVALPLRSGFDALVAARDVAERLGIQVIVAVDFFGQAPGIPVDTPGGGLSLQYNQHPARRLHNRLAKRALDVAVAVGALIVLSPFLVLAALAIFVTMGRPILFVQERVGLNRRRFPMLKFRTMVAGADARPASLVSMDPSGVIFKAQADPRVTRVGRWLRRTSIDELPQLVNVLRGDMSLVGPRPLPVWVVAHVEDVDFHRRSSVLPGLTGAWQVEGRVQEFPVMMAHDLSYVDSWSLGADVRLLLRTPLEVLRGTGAQ